MGEIIEGRSNRIEEFYYWLWFDGEKIPLEASVTDVFDCRRIKVTRQLLRIRFTRLGIMVRHSSSP